MSIIMLVLLSSSSLFPQIGITQRTFVDTIRKRNLNTTLIYPSKSDSMISFAGNKVFEGFKASMDGQFSTVKELPLIILIHGTSGNWRNLTWLGASLAEEGAIVVAANHEGSTTGDASPASVICMWHQPKDISFLIDTLLKSEFSSFIDENKIIVIGNSLGGYSALALTGARLNFENYNQFCLNHNDGSTEYFRPVLEYLDDEFYEKADALYLDKRIDLAIALVPGFVEVMNFNLMKNSLVPALIVGASLDENLPPDIHYTPFINKFPETWKYIEIEGATHFSFLQTCHSEALKILSEENEAFVCLEKGDKTRHNIHQEVYVAIIHFINTHF